MASHRFAPLPPKAIWFCLILFACFSLATSLSCSSCNDADTCKNGGTKEECTTPPPPNKKHACQTITDNGKITLRGCTLGPEDGKDNCTGALCLCYTDGCNGEIKEDNGNKGKGNGKGNSGMMRPTPWTWSSLFWIGQGLACFCMAILH